MSFIVWFDDSKKKPTATKLAEGAAAYLDRYGHPCNVVYVNDADKDVAAPDGLTVKTSGAAGYVRPDNFWFGYEPFVS